MQVIWNNPTTLKQRNKSGGLTISSFNTYYKTIVLGHNDRQINEVEKRMPK